MIKAKINPLWDFILRIFKSLFLILAIIGVVILTSMIIRTITHAILYWFK